MNDDLFRIVGRACHPQINDGELDPEIVALRTALIRMTSERDAWRSSYQALHNDLEKLLHSR